MVPAMRRTRNPIAAFAVLVFVVGQLWALAHEAEERHAVCAEHGESIEAPELAGEDDSCEHAHWIAVEGGDGEHVDCEISRVLRNSTAPTASAPTLVVIDAISTYVTPPLTEQVAVLDLDLVLLAPKTSPPRAA